MRDQLGGRERGPPRLRPAGAAWRHPCPARGCQSLCQPEAPRPPPEQQEALCRLGPRGCDTGPCSQAPHLGA